MASMAPLRGVLLDIGYGLLDEGPRLAHALQALADDPLLALAQPPQPAWAADAPASLAPVLLEPALARLEACYAQACLAPAHSSLLVQALEAAGVPPEAAAAARERLAWDAVPLAPYPDTLAALERLGAAGLRVGVLANQPASARRELQRLGVALRVDDTWLSGEVGLSKPDPAFFRRALHAWGMPAGEVAYVGDRPDHDIGPAHALGLRTVRLLQGPHARQVARAGQHADANAPTLSRAADVLIGWARGR
ncbi:MAG: HAD family hydrolase [Planctomycetia bacterium]